jgi:hypothetical protein
MANIRLPSFNSLDPISFHVDSGYPAVTTMKDGFDIALAVSLGVSQALPHRASCPTRKLCLPRGLPQIESLPNSFLACLGSKGPHRLFRSTYRCRRYRFAHFSFESQLNMRPFRHFMDQICNIPYMIFKFKANSPRLQQRRE